MLRKLNLRGRFNLLIALPLLTLLAVGGMAWWNTTASGRALNALHHHSERQLPLERLERLIGGTLNTLVQQIARNSIGWDPALDQLTRLHDRFEALWEQHLDQLSTSERERVEHLHRGTVEGLRSALSELSRLLVDRDRTRLRLFIVNDYDALTLPYLEILRARIAQRQFIAGQHYQAARNAVQQRTWLTLGLLGLGLLLISVVWHAVQHSIMQPVGRIATVARAVALGDYNPRVGFSGRDELGKLGQALDRVLDEQHAHKRELTEKRTQPKESTQQESVTAPAPLSPTTPPPDILERLRPQLQQLGQGDLSVHLPTGDDTLAPLTSALDQLLQRVIGTLHEAHRLAAQITGQPLESSAEREPPSGNDKLSEIALISELSGTLDTDLKSLAELAHIGGQAIDTAARNNQAALSAIRQHANDAPKTHHETPEETRKQVEKLRHHATGILSLGSDLTAAAEQARILELNANLRSTVDHNSHTLQRELKALARALRRSEQQLLELGNRVETDADALLAHLAERGSLSNTPTNDLQEVVARLTEAHHALAESTSALHQITAESRALTRTSGQLLVHSMQWRTDHEQLLQRMQGRLAQTDTLTRTARVLQQRLQTFRLPAEQNERDSLPIKPA